MSASCPAADRAWLANCPTAAVPEVANCFAAGAPFVKMADAADENRLTVMDRAPPSSSSSS